MTEIKNKDLKNLSTEERRLLLKNLIQKKMEGEKKRPLSFAQERLWFLGQFYPDSPIYNIPLTIPFSGLVNIKVLEDSINEIIRRHEALRTTFDTIDGELQQIITPSLKLPLPVVDLQSMPEQAREAEIQRLASQDASLPFDLINGPLLRCTLVHLTETDHIVILSMHHIISDGWSLGIFVQELSSIYQAFSGGRPSPLKDLPIQYSEYAVWQRQRLQGERLANLSNNWKKLLEGAPTILDLPTDYPRPATQTFQGAYHHFIIPKSNVDGLHQIAREEEATLFMTLLASFSILLSRYSGQDDLLIGSPIANRPRPEIEGLIGFFVNTIILRCNLSDRPSFRQFTRSIRDMALEAYAHLDLPFERLVEELQPERNLSHNPIIQVLLVFQNLPEALNGSEDQKENTPPPMIGTGTSKFDLTIFMTNGANGLNCALEYNVALFEKSTIERMAGHYSQLVEAILSNPDQQVSSLPLMNSAERQQLLVDWNATDEKRPTDRCIHDLFEEQAAKSPKAIAVEFGEQQLTYQELDKKSNQLAQYLRKQGVRPDTCVGLCMDRSPELMVALLGILKAGGAYVPLDPSYPSERLEYMLKDSKASIVITEEQHKTKVAKAATKLINFDEDWPTISKGKNQAVESAVDPDHLGYVIYTSGSTGQPKGVGMNQSVLVNLISWQIKEAQLNKASRILQFTTINFDVSFQEIFSAICSGGTLVLIAEEHRFDPKKLLNYIGVSAIERVFIPPIMLQHICEAEGTGQSLQQLHQLKEIIVAGEQLVIKPSIKQFFSMLPHVLLTNHYGPCETHVVTQFKLEAPAESWPTLPSIGKPIANTQIYLLDKHLQLVNIGAVGEVYIGGNVARGYLNRPSLTAERFIPDPFSQEPGKRLYRTGDRARYRADGNIEFIGRVDHQIKIRGFRIEPREIEIALCQHTKIDEAIVSLIEDTKGNKRLVAFLTSEEAEPPSFDSIKDFLLGSLPNYMIPSSFKYIDSLPLLPNGKLNRKATILSSIAESSDTTYTAPRNSIEADLSEIWLEVLKIEKIGVYDNFFELGGYSLLVTQVVSRIRQKFAIDIKIRDVFEAPTIASLTIRIVEKRAAKMENEELMEILSTLEQYSDEDLKNFKTD